MDGTPRVAKRTWNPEVSSHFHHILTIMRPHFADREPSYTSFLGMPDTGNPLMACKTKDDWELTYEDYETPADVKEWFGLRTDLFFNMLKPTEELIHRLDKHYLAFLIPYECENCRGGITVQWASRFAKQYTLRCNLCGYTKVISRNDMSLIHLDAETDEKGD